MFNKILLIDPQTTLGPFLSHSLAVEGYEVITKPSPNSAQKKLAELRPHLVLLNGVGQSKKWLANAEKIKWAVPTITLADRPDSASEATGPGQYLAAPFAFQDLLLLIQDLFYQRTLTGRQPFQLSADLVDHIETILDTLRTDLRARCAILSTSGGRLIKTAGVVEQGVAMSLAALMSAGFSATARAAQLLGHGEMFDSSLQESEGYGLYAIRLQDRLVLSVAFSDKITVGMVRHYTAQAAIDLLELLTQQAHQTEDANILGLDDNFLQTVNQALEEFLKD